MKYNYNYLIINLLNGKYYIGKHSTDNLNDGYMGSGQAIQAAITKYGKENFIKLILNFCDSEEEAYVYEKLMIKEWMINGRMCYNLVGSGAAGFGYKHTEETLKKLSELHKGKKLTPETRKKLSELHKGKNFSEEHKQHLSESQKGRKQPKYKWLAPDGTIHIMDKSNAKKYHPDWKLIEE